MEKITLFYISVFTTFNGHLINNREGFIKKFIGEGSSTQKLNTEANLSFAPLAIQNKEKQCRKKNVKKTRSIKVNKNVKKNNHKNLQAAIKPNMH